MFKTEKRKNLQNAAFLLDMVHIMIGLIIVVLAVVTFLNPEDHMLMFPVIFFLAAVLNLIRGSYQLKENRRHKKKKLTGFLSVAVGILLILLCVVSGISIWR